MLRLFISAAVAALIFASGAIQAFGADYYATMDVFVRREANVESAVMSSLTRGDLVDVIEKAGDWWYKIRLGNGATGYASALYVHEPQGEGEEGGTLMTVNTPYLNVRAGAGVDYFVVGMLYGGEQVYVMETYASGWVKASGYGFTAYVYGKYLK